MKEHKMMMKGVGFENDRKQKLKIRLIRKITDKSYNLQTCAIISFKKFLAYERANSVARRIKAESEKKEKKRILGRIMDSNLRFIGSAFRQSQECMEAEREKERVLIFKQRGIMRKILDANTRMVSAGYNKLMEQAKVRRANLMNRLKFVIKSLTDIDARWTLMAYNEMKQFAYMLDSEDFATAEHKKKQLIKRLMNQGYNIQIMSINALKSFLKREREEEMAIRLGFER